MRYQEIKQAKGIMRGFVHEACSAQLVILFHGFMGNKVDHHGMMKQYAETIAEAGCNAARFDFLGSGDSDGSFYMEERLASQLAQGRTLIRTFLAQGYRVHLFAFSMGGIIATHLAKQEPIESLFLLSPAGNFPELLAGMLSQGERCGEDHAINGFLIHPDFIHEVSKFPIMTGLEGFEKPVKLVQGTQDPYVTKESFQRYANIYPNADTKLITGADHCFSTVSATAQVRKEIKDFYGKITHMAKQAK